jgi:hypothetical protein
LLQTIADKFQQYVSATDGDIKKEGTEIDAAHNLTLKVVSRVPWGAAGATTTTYYQELHQHLDVSVFR